MKKLLLTTALLLLGACAEEPKGQTGEGLPDCAEWENVYAEEQITIKYDAPPLGGFVCNFDGKVCSFEPKPDADGLIFHCPID